MRRCLHTRSMIALVRDLCKALASEAAAAVTCVCGMTCREARLLVEGVRGGAGGGGGVGGADLEAR